MWDAKSKRYQDQTKLFGVDESFWSWNAQAADFDADGWMDIYVANGTPYSQESRRATPNVFYHNQAGNVLIPLRSK